MPELAFIDFETRSLRDVTVVGAYHYAKHSSTDALVLGYAFDDDHCKVWSPRWAWGNTVISHADDEHPYDLLKHVAEGGDVIAWNAFFDRWIWNAVMVPKYGWPRLPLEQVLCAQAQAEANNLPGKLEKAAETLGTYHRKDPAGKRLIAQLSNGTRENWQPRVFETPKKMGHFRAYCMHDVTSMRDIWQHTRPLFASEWDEYHASERINDRGVGVDSVFARAAMEYATAEFQDINEQLFEITGDEKLTVTNHLRKARWLYDQLWPAPELQEIVKRKDKVKKLKDGSERTVERFSADRPTREAVLEMIMQPDFAEVFEDDHAAEIVTVLELIEAGNSAAVRKFTAICNQQIAGRIHGQYSFNGAGQTGRFSSRGIQIHNVIRDPVDKENSDRAIDAIEDILQGSEPESLVAKYKYPLSRLLARLIRPTFIAAPEKLLVWADWDQIEGRCLPWLSASPGGNAKLDLYREGIDVYSVTASQIAGVPLSAVSDAMRQALGKVPELALGFGGAVGALAAMSRSYGVLIPAEEMRGIVDRWRAENAWCVHFWHELWEAAITAYNYPGTWWTAGRVSYMYHPDVMRGTLICRLPDGRWLVYPQFKHEKVDYIAEKDTARHKAGDHVVEWRTTFVRGYGSGAARIELWYGILAENITQAVAASFLRRALLAMDETDSVVLHTHDEIVCEVDGKNVHAAGEMLRREMTYLPEWAEGLPLTVSVESGPYYTKGK